MIPFLMISPWLAYEMWVASLFWMYPVERDGRDHTHS